HGIQLKSGRLLVPVWISTGTGSGGHRPSVTATIFSDDGGSSWHSGEIAFPNSREWVNPSEAMLVELSDGQVMMNGRTESRASRRLVTTSPDGATQWAQPHFDEALGEPVCMGSITRLSVEPRKSRILFSNPDNLSKSSSEEKSVSGARKNLSIKLSYDEAKTWPVNKVLEPGFSAYSDLAVLPHGTILCLFERGAGRVDFLTLARFNLEWLTDGKDSYETST
ncbi:MAG TPA: sialidase family protein, partial [Candidatus Saccharimonadales bacterium]|nr:sialidase family protein [Candidatus Saccharimonadales bacterium]